MAKSKTLAQFREKYDPSVAVPNKIRKALADMKAEGADSWEYELDFIKRANSSPSEIALYREQFAGHVVEVRERSRGTKRVWFADVGVAKKALG